MSGTVIEVSPRSRADIRGVAHRIHDIVKRQPPPFPIVEFIECLLPRLWEDFTFSVQPVAALGDNHGVTFPDERMMIIREDIYERAVEGRGRDRLTVAHELGHLLLHTGVRFARHVDPKSIQTFRSSEWQANCFAGELLVPSWYSAQFTTVDITAEICNVSREAAETQLRAFGRL
jgi:hypothetical protein